MDRKEYESLVAKIEHLNKCYYNFDKPEVSDYEYDMLNMQLKKVEAEHPEWITKSPSQHVGGSATFNKVKHRNSMLSISDVFTKEDITKWVNDISKELHNSPKFIVEPKIDGLSVSLRYINGNLYLAETRGDGLMYGEDITANALQINDIPKHIDGCEDLYVELRGEVYMDKESFKKLNEDLDIESQFANSRNASAGTLRQLDPQIVKDRHLSMFIFNLQEIQGEDISSHVESYTWMKDHNIKHITGYYICNTANEVWEAIQAIGRSRETLDYDIDGAVVKIDSYSDRQILGVTSKYHKWALAYKYPPEEKETIVRDITIQVGRTGKLTPVAIFDPIHLGGTTVERATLHNQAFINTLGVNIGSTVKVCKSGDIIPKITKVIELPWDKSQQPYKIKKICPVCRSEAIDDSAEIRCINLMCPARALKSLEHFCSKQGMNIEGLGPKNLELLYNNNIVNSPLDLYLLKDKSQRLADILGHKNSGKILLSIEMSKDRSAEHLLYSLGIPGVGFQMGKQLMLHYEFLENLADSSLEELNDITGIGPIAAKNIIMFFENPEIRTFLKTLEDIGVNTFYIPTESGDALKGMNISITGSFKGEYVPGYSRDVIEELIIANGGSVVPIGKKTNYILAGINPTESKIKFAKQNNVPVIDLDWIFIKLSAKKGDT